MISEPEIALKILEFIVLAIPAFAIIYRIVINQASSDISEDGSGIVAIKFVIVAFLGFISLGTLCLSGMMISVYLINETDNFFIETSLEGMALVFSFTIYLSQRWYRMSVIDYKNAVNEEIIEPIEDNLSELKRARDEISSIDTSKRSYIDSRRDLKQFAQSYEDVLERSLESYDKQREYVSDTIDEIDQSIKELENSLTVSNELKSRMDVFHYDLGIWPSNFPDKKDVFKIINQISAFLYGASVSLIISSPDEYISAKFLVLITSILIYMMSDDI
jgi:methyl-accepting chemotaxis protein